MRQMRPVLNLIALILLFATMTSVSRAEERLYFLKDPLSLDVQIKRVGKTFLYILYGGKAAFVAKGAILGHMGPVGITLLTAGQLLRSLPSLPVNSMGLLKLKQGRKWANLESTLKDIPGIKGAAILMATPYQQEGLMIVGMHRKGYVALVSDKPLDKDPEFTRRFGEAIEIKDPKKVFLNLRLNIDGQTHPLVWGVSVADALEKSQMPNEIADQWRTQWVEFQKSRKFVDRWITHRNDFQMDVGASLNFEGQPEIPLGPVFAGRNVSALLGMSLGRQISKFFNEDQYANGHFNVKTRSYRCQKLLTLGDYLNRPI